MKKILLTILLFSPVCMASAQDCPDYCSNSTFYSNGTLNRSGECEYSARSKCDYGCQDRSKCAEKPETRTIAKECKNYCSRNIYYYNGEYDANDDNCDYDKRTCDYECDDSAGCKTAPTNNTEIAPVQTETRSDSETTAETIETRSEERTEEEPAMPLVNTNIGSAAEKTSTLNYKKGESQENAEVAKSGVELFVEGKNIKISGSGKSFVFENNFKSIENRYRISQRTIEKVEAKIEKNSQGEDKPFYLFTLKTPVKLLWIFKVIREEAAKVDAETGQEISIQRPWWSIISSDPKPEKLIANFCQQNKDCQKYEDDDLCNGILYCNLAANQCQPIPPTIINCPKKDSPDGCKTNTCNPQNGKCEMKAQVENNVCDDGNFCTIGDVCQTGQCQSGKNTCQCQNNSDCAQHEDGNLCNGTLFCNKLKGQCELNPVTIVYCQPVDDTECQKNTCNPEAGACEMKAINIGKACEGTHTCVDSICTDKGKCEGSWNFNKINENGSFCQCLNNEDCQPFENGNLCDGTLYCDKNAGTCKISDASLIYCPSVYDTETKKNTCQPLTGECVIQTATD